MTDAEQVLFGLVTAAFSGYRDPVAMQQGELNTIARAVESVLTERLQPSDEAVFKKAYLDRCAACRALARFEHRIPNRLKETWMGEVDAEQERAAE